jgi:N-acetylglucosamine kinase-like BadF-type ATPase
MSRGPARAARPAVLAVDGGNSKADAILIDRTGSILGAARWIGPSNVGTADGSVAVLTDAIAAACADAAVPLERRPVAPVGVYCLAGADFPIDERRVGRGLARGGWTERNVVRNDTFAVLRAGTDRGWGVAVVCGAGMNCLGVAPDGRTVRFPAIGPLSGDFAAGGEWVGLAALGAAIRARDGRGPRTALERAVPRHFGMARPETVMNAMHRGRLMQHRLVELPPAVFGAAESGDAVARSILDRVADEVVAMATASIRRLRLSRTDLDLVLGGGMFRSKDREFVDRVERGIHAVAPRASVVTLSGPPVLGAGLMGLDEIEAPRDASLKLRRSIDHATVERSGNRSRPTTRADRRA